VVKWLSVAKTCCGCVIRSVLEASANQKCSLGKNLQKSNCWLYIYIYIYIYIYKANRYFLCVCVYIYMYILDGLSNFLQTRIYFGHNTGPIVLAF
jgi:hypothetical protein